MPYRFTVLGAGIVGTCCALALRRDGHAVTLVDRDGPGEGCSSGNAGFIQTGTPVPMATPGILRRTPKLLFDPESALSIRWRYLPRLAPWLLRFLRASRPDRAEAISIALASLLDATGEAYRRVLHDAGGQDLVRHRGLLFVFPDRASMVEAEWEFALFRRRGVAVEAMDGSALRRMEPELSRAYAHGYYLPETFYTVDPLRLTRALFDRFVALGGVFLQDTVRDIEVERGGPAALLGDSGRVEVDRLVLAAGAFSKGFAARLGSPVPLESARGYHLMLPEPGIDLQGPLLDGVRHFGVTPMREGLRLAGTLELASLDAPPNYARADMLLPMAKAMLPGLEGRVGARWLGHRPATPDSLPVLGPSPRYPNLFFAFGHGQLGLTLGPVSGEVIADLAAGRDPGIDLTPFRPDRF